MRRAPVSILLLAGCGASAPTPAPPVPPAPAPPPVQEAPAPPSAEGPPPTAAHEHDDLRVGSRPWIDPSGTAIVGFGLLRLVPDPGKTARFDLRYEEKPGDYGSGDDAEFQFFVLPGDAFATKSSAYADEFLAFTRSHGASTAGSYALRASVEVREETTVIVAYGPWTAPDSGRPAGDRPVFRIGVVPHDGAFEWLESEAGELITNNWTNRPGVRRGGPYAKESMWVEVRPMILYDGRMVRAADEPPGGAGNLEFGVGNDPRDALDRKEEKEDTVATRSRADRRIVMTRELAEKFRRVPIRWR